MNAPAVITFGLLAIVQFVNVTYFEGLKDDFSNLILQVNSFNDSYFVPYNITQSEPGSWAMVAADLPEEGYTLNLMSSADAQFSTSYEPNILEISYSPVFNPDFSNLAIQFESDGKTVPVSYSVVGFSEGDWVIVALERAPLPSETVNLLAVAESQTPQAPPPEENGTGEAPPSVTENHENPPQEDNATGPALPAPPSVEDIGVQPEDFNISIHNSKGTRIDFDVAADIRTSDLGSPEALQSVLPKGMSIRKITFRGLKSGRGILGMEMLPLDTPAPEGGKWLQAYAIDPTGLNFTSADVTVVAAGNALFKCKDWDFDGQSCGGDWVMVRDDLVPGKEYSFILSPEDPGFGEMNIAVINVFSTPAAGGNWTVYFNTTGQADLEVRASNGTTWDDLDQDVDLNFLELRCGDALLDPVWDDAIKTVIQPAYQCNETGSITSKVITASNHALKFTFWLSEDYAYNDVVNITNCTTIASPGTYALVSDISGAPVSASPKSGSACIKINSSDVSLDCSGFKISNDGTPGNTYGVLMAGPMANASLMNCGNISGYTYGIYLYQANGSSVSNVTSTSSTGIAFEQASNNTVDGSIIQTSAGSGRGLLFVDEQSDGDTVLDTDISTFGSSAIGIYLSGGADNNTFSGVNISDNASNAFGLYLAGGSGDNNFTGGRIVGTYYAAYFQSGLPGNTIEDSYIESSGSFIRTIYLYLSSGTNILNNVIKQSNASGYNALRLDTSPDTTVIGNNMTNSCAAFNPESCAVMDIYYSSNTTGSNNRFDNPNQLSFWVNGNSAPHFTFSFANDTGDGVPVYLIGPDDPRSSVSDSAAKEIWVAKDGFLFDNITMDDAELIMYSYVSNATLNDVSFNATMGSSIGAVRYVNATGNTLSNSTIVTYNTSRYGLDFTDELSDGNLVSDTDIRTFGSSAYGIYLYGGADNNTFSGVNVSNNASNANGYYLYGPSGDNNFTGGRIVSTYYAAYFQSGLPGNTIEDSYIESSGSFIRTIYLYLSSGTNILNNVIKQSNASGYNALILDTSPDTTVIGNNMTNSCAAFNRENCAVMDIVRSSNTTGSNNRFDNPNQLSFWVNGNSAPHFTFSFANDTGDGVPVYLIGSNDPRSSVSDSAAKEIWVAKDGFLFDNITMDDAELIMYSYVSNATLNDVFINASLASSFGAVQYMNATGNTLRNSTIVTYNSGKYGLEFTDELSDGNLVSDTDIRTFGSNAYGIYLYGGADNNTFSGVNVSNNASNGIGFYISSSSGDNIFTGGRIVSPYYAVDFQNGLPGNTLQDSYFESSLSYQPVYIYTTSGSRILDNVINQSSLSGSNALRLESSANTIVIGNNMTTSCAGFNQEGCAVMYLIRSSNTTGSNNRFDNPNQLSFWVNGNSAPHFTFSFANDTGDGVPVYLIGPDDPRSSVSDSAAKEIWVAKDGFLFDNITMDDAELIMYSYVSNATLNDVSFNATMGSNLGAVQYMNATGNTLRNSTIATYNSNRYGLYFPDELSDGNLVSDTSIITFGTGAHGIYLYGGADNNTFSGVNVSNNASSGVGFYIPSTSGDNNFTGGKIVTPYYAVYLQNGLPGNTIEDSYIESSGTSQTFYIYNSPGAKILRNVINQSNPGGVNDIYVLLSANASIVGNNIFNSRTGYSSISGSLLYLSSSGSNALVVGNRFDNPNQNKIYIDSSFGASTISGNIFGRSDGNIFASSIVSAGGPTSTTFNLSNNILVGPRLELGGFQFNLTDNTFMAVDGSDQIAFPSLLFNGSPTFHMNESNLFVNNNVTAVNASSSSLNLAFNSSARVTFFDVNCSNFGIHYNPAFITNFSTMLFSPIVATQVDTGGNCSGNVCSAITCSNSTLSFTAPSWSTYAVENDSHLSCPPPITAPMNYTMSSDFTGVANLYSGGAACVYIASSDVTFDCNGFSLLNNVSYPTAGIAVENASNVVVKNCGLISNYTNGIHVINSVTSAFTNITITNATYAVVLNQSRRNSFDTILANQTGLGFFLSGSLQNNFTGNIVDQNFNQGFTLDSTSHANSLIGNLVMNGQGSSGISVLSENNTLSGNQVINYTSANAFEFYAGGNNVSGNLANQTSLGFYLSQSPSNVFTGNIVDQNFNQGFTLDSTSPGNSLLDNLVMNGQGSSGISVLSGDNTLSGNQVINYTSANAFEFYAGGNNVSGNLANQTSLGFRLSGSAGNNFTDNTVDQNTNQGFSLDATSGGNSLIGNNVMNGQGPSAYSVLSASNTLRLNNATNYTGGYGYEFYAGGNNVTGNLASQTSLGFYLSGSMGNSFTGNIVDQNTNQGFLLDSASHGNSLLNNFVTNGQGSSAIAVLSENNTLSGNIIRNYTGYGFELYAGNNGFSGNLVSITTSAFYLSGVSSSNFTNNTAYSNLDGFELLDSSGNLFSANNITLNSGTGVQLNSSSGLNDFNSNFLCSNGVDIDNQNSSNTGALDRCDAFVSWSENGHFGCEYSCSSMWQRYFGGVNGTIILGDSGTGPYVYSWNGTAINIYFADSDSVISWRDLQAIGMNTSNQPSIDDFSELDTAFNTTAYGDNINLTYSIDGTTPRQTEDFSIFQRPVLRVPVASSAVGNTSFRTGILWDMSDGGREYDTAFNQTTVWVVKINASTPDLYGTYDYLAQVPKTLGSYEGSNDVISIYLELQ